MMGQLQKSLQFLEDVGLADEGAKKVKATLQDIMGEELSVDSEDDAMNRKAIEENKVKGTFKDVKPLFSEVPGLKAIPRENDDNQVALHEVLEEQRKLRAEIKRAAKEKAAAAGPKKRGRPPKEKQNDAKEKAEEPEKAGEEHPGDDASMEAEVDDAERAMKNEREQEDAAEDEQDAKRRKATKQVASKGKRQKENETGKGPNTTTKRRRKATESAAETEDPKLEVAKKDEVQAIPKQKSRKPKADEQPSETKEVKEDIKPKPKKKAEKAAQECEEN